MGSYCAMCGTWIPDGHNFCIRCGAKAEHAEEDNWDSETIVAPVPVVLPNGNGGRNGAGNRPGHDSGYGYPDGGFGGGSGSAGSRDGGRPAGGTGYTHPAAAGPANMRVIRLMSLLLAIGLFVLFTGLTGRVIMGRIVGEVEKMNIVDESDDLGKAINKAGRREAINLFSAIIKGDTAGVENTISKIIGVAGSMAGDPYGINDGVGMLLDVVVSEAVQEAREMIKEKAGAAWILLQMAAYNRELLIAGAVMVLLALIVIYVKGGFRKGIMRKPLIPAFAVPCSIGALMLVAGFLVPFSMNAQGL